MDNKKAIDEQIKSLLSKHKRLNQSSIMSEIPNMTNQELCGSLNRLLKQNVIEVLRDQNQLHYQLKDATSVELCKNMGQEEIAVFDCVKNAGSKGIFVQNIKDKTGIPSVHLNKCLKKLVSDKIIAAYSHANSKTRRKTYVLSSIKPDVSITGGIFYSESSIDTEFVRKLKEICYAFIDKKKTQTSLELLESGLYATVSLREVVDFLTRHSNNQINITAEDVTRILDGLVHQGKIQKIEPTFDAHKSIPAKRFKSETCTDNVQYRIQKYCVDTSEALLVPCTLCAFVDRCRTNKGRIYPGMCSRLAEFTDF